MITMLLTWLLVTTGCEAGKTLALPIHYDIRYNARRLLRWDPCPTPEQPEALCPVYSPFAWTGDGTFGNSIDTGELDLAPGEVLTYEVTAVDAQGNRDC